MVKVIKRGEKYIPDTEIVCNNCKSHLYFSLKYDTFVTSSIDKDGRAHVFSYISCPVCNRDVIIYDNDNMYCQRIPEEKDDIYD